MKKQELRRALGTLRPRETLRPQVKEACLRAVARRERRRDAWRVRRLPLAVSCCFAALLLCVGMPFALSAQLGMSLSMDGAGTGDGVAWEDAVTSSAAGADTQPEENLPQAPGTIVSESPPGQSDSGMDAVQSQPGQEIYEGFASQQPEAQQTTGSIGGRDFPVTLLRIWSVAALVAGALALSGGLYAVLLHRMKKRQQAKRPRPENP